MKKFKSLLAIYRFFHLEEVYVGPTNLHIIGQRQSFKQNYCLSINSGFPFPSTQKRMLEEKTLYAIDGRRCSVDELDSNILYDLYIIIFIFIEDGVLYATDNDKFLESYEIYETTLKKLGSLKKTIGLLRF